MIIAFYTPTIDIRGTCVAIYDYAHYNEVLLGNTSVIITSDVKQICNINDPVIQKNSNRITVHFAVVVYIDLHSIRDGVNCLHNL